MLAAMVVSLDTSSIAVALPSIVREYGSTLGATQWLVTGYLLVFGAVLLAGGRLGDMYGHRRMLITGVVLFGVGSAFAGEAQSLPGLLLPRAILCGVGVALAMPATGSMLSLTFQGHARAKAFATWGAVTGVAAAFGPVLGGYLTSEHSWRWCFRINVVASVAIIALACAVLDHGRPDRDRGRLDVAGIALSGTGMLLLVVGLSEGGDYGWFRPNHDLSYGSFVLWPADRSLSVVPVVLAASLLSFVAFYRVERRRERRGADPLVAFNELLAEPRFRYGVLAAACVAMGQYGLIFVLPIFLQESVGLTAGQSGAWQLVPGTFIVVGAVLGARFARSRQSIGAVRIGLALEAAGLGLLALAFTRDASLWDLLPGFVLFGIGVGGASAQVSNVVVAGVAGRRIGIANATNSIARQVGSMIAASLIASLLAVTSVNTAVQRVSSSSTLPEGTRHQVVEQLRTGGLSFELPPGLTALETAEVTIHLEEAVSIGSRAPMILVGLVCLLGLALATRVPAVARATRTSASRRL